MSVCDGAKPITFQKNIISIGSKHPMLSYYRVLPFDINP